MTRLARASLGLAAVGGVLLCISLLLRDHRGGGDLRVWTKHHLTEFTPENGLAFRTVLPAGAPSAHLGPISAALFEDGVPVGHEAPHDEIRGEGGGLFSFWNGTLYLSTTDNTDPRTNGRRYEVAWPSPFATAVEWASRTFGYGALGLGGLAWCLLVLAPIVGLGRLLRRHRRLVLKFMLVPASLLVALLCAEGWLRLRYAFADNVWPTRLDPTVGFVFQPHATVRWTNLRDFCVEQNANSLGFLDDEPVRDLAPGRRRIVVLGDSFVEAVQVPLATKFHIVLERSLEARGQSVAVDAFGRSGCGTTDELAFYEQFASSLHPDLVILLFINNDIANNSSLLESIRYAWNPAHTPKQFFVKVGDTFRRLAVDVDWNKHTIPSDVPAAPNRASWWRWSRLYRWVQTNLGSATGSAVQSTYDLYAERLAWLRREPQWRDALAGWNWPDDMDIDSMTACVDPPRAFLDARDLTEHALRELRDRVRSDNARLLVVGCHHLGSPSTGQLWHRRFLPRCWLDLVEPMCARLDLPFLDLRADFEKRGVLDKVTFSSDGHWNALGHASAAAAIDEYLQQHPDLLGPH